MLPEISNFSLGIGIPCNFQLVPASFFMTFAQMDRPDFHLLPARSGPLDVMRNDIVERAMYAGCSHLVMMDTDMTYHPQTITKLLSHKLPVVGALCYRRYPPFDPLMYRGELNSYQSITDWKPGDLIEVDATGTGCIMFEMSVFKRLPKPWFRFRPNPDADTMGDVGEDIGFCYDLRKMGYTIHVDTSVPSGHLSTMEVTEKTWLLYKALKNQQDNKKV